jgi:hypothetical protein
MQSPILKVSIETVQAVICKEFKLSTAPGNITLSDLGLSYADLIKLKSAFRRVFMQDIAIKLSDSVTEITNRMQDEI